MTVTEAAVAADVIATADVMAVFRAIGLETAIAAVLSGSSSFCAYAETTDGAADAETDVAMTTAAGSSFSCCFSVAMDGAADVAADKII